MDFEIKINFKKQISFLNLKSIFIFENNLIFKY